MSSPPPKVVLRRMQLTLHATRQTPHGASRGSMAIRLRPCMRSSTSLVSPPTFHFSTGAPPQLSPSIKKMLTKRSDALLPSCKIHLRPLPIPRPSHHIWRRRQDITYTSSGSFEAAFKRSDTLIYTWYKLQCFDEHACCITRRMALSANPFFHAPIVLPARSHQTRTLCITNLLQELFFAPPFP